MDFGLKDKVAIVTGAGSGIGAASARALVQEGARVVVVDIVAAKAEAMAASIREAGGDALGVAADVTDAGSVAALVETTVARCGTVHILVNNAGFTRDMRIGKMPESDWDAVVDVVLKGAFLCAKAVMPHMAQQNWGRVINMSSRAHLGNPGQVNYSAAKAGLLGFTRALALEEGRHWVTVNAIAPGIIDTEMVKALPHYDKVRAAAEKTTPIPRMGSPEDVAAAVVFLASERASYITGEVLHVTGGRY